MQMQLDRLEGKFDKILKSKAKKSSLSPSPIPAPVPHRSEPLGSPGEMFALQFLPLWPCTPLCNVAVYTSPYYFLPSCKPTFA